MCIIAFKPKGVGLPSIEILKRIYNKNPDGAGIAYALDGVITLSKGYMDINEYIKAVQKIPVDAAAIIHTRISTSGGICKELTHPYKLTNDYKELRKTSLKISNGYAVAHNGVFSEFGRLADANDTMQFIATYLNPLKEIKDAAGGAIIDEDIKPLINKLVSGSRLVILNTNGDYQLYGNYWHEANGIYYSNEGYKQQEYYATYFNNKYNGYTNYGGSYKSLKDAYINDCTGFCKYCKHNKYCPYYADEPAPAGKK